MSNIGRFHFSETCNHCNYLPPSHREILKGLSKSYVTDDAIEHLIEQTTSSRNIISLRLLDWFVTNYSKKNQTSWVIRDKYGDHVVIQAHQQYVIELGNWRRILFDPFQRRNRINFRSRDGSWHTTTVAQLNFLKFANYTGIYDYVSLHRVQIEEDMNRTSKSKKQRIARKSLSACPGTVFCVAHVTQMTA